jgi:TP901 family phage tail tape measure protein/lambda family phage tail tape measure protein
MSMNMDAAIRIKANVQGGNAIQAFSRDLKGLDGAAKLSGAELGRMNIAINRMAREAGNTTAGLRQHLSALQNLRDRVEIGGKAYNRLGGEIEQLKGKLRGLDAQAEKTGNTLRDKLLGGLATLGVGRIAGGITRTAANFDAELRKAAAIEGGGNFDALRKDIERVAAAAAGTPTEVAQLATALSRAGFTAKETGEALQGIVRGAEATAVSFEEMGSITADSMRAFGIETSKTEAVVDILVKTANSSNQTVQDLGESLKYAAPIARSLGVNINDLSATMGILANNGIRGSEAGTALRTGLGRLQLAASGSNDELLGLTKGSALLADAMKTLGADVVDAQGNLKPMDEVLISLKRNLENLPKGVQVEVLKALFGDEAGGKLRAALNSTEADIRKMFDTIRNSGGAAEQTQKEMQGFAYSLSVLGGNIEIVTNAIGEKFAMVLKPLADGLSAVISWTQTWPQPLKDVAAGAAAAGIAVGGLALAIKTLGGLGALAGIVQGVGLAFTGAAAGVKVFTVALLANPIGLAVAGVVALTVAAYNLSEPFKQFVDTYPQRLEIFWKSLANDATAAINRVKQLWEDLKGAVQGVVDGIEQRWNEFTNWFGGIWESIKGFVKRALAAIGIDASQLSAAMNKIANDIEYWWNVAFRIIAENWQKTVANMINNTNPLFAVLKRLGVVDVGGAAANALFGDLPPVPQRRGPQANVIAAAPTSGGTMDFAGGGSGSGGKGRSGKTVEDISAAELLYRRQLIAAREEGNALIEAAIQLELDLLEVAKLAETPLKQQLAFEEAFARYRKSEKDAAKEIGREVAKDFTQRREKAEEFARVIEDLKIKTGEIAGEKLKELEIDREIEAIRKRFPDLTQEQIDKVKELVTASKEVTKSFGQSFKDKLKEYADSVKDLGGALGDVVVGAFKGLEDKLTEFVTTGKANFKELAASILTDLARIAIRAAIIQPLLSGFGSMFGLKLFAGGGIMGPQGEVPLKKYARGGIANSPQLAMFGEGSTPEAYVPLPDGRRIPVAMKGGGGGGTNVTVNVDASGSQVQGDAGKGEQLGRFIAQAIQNELIRQQRPGGLLAA